MRYSRCIAAFVALVLATACTISDIDDTPINVNGSKGELQVVGRVTQFSDCDVATRSKKEGDEPKVTSMGLALFPIVNGVVGNCVYYDYKVGGSIVFVVDRASSVFDSYKNTDTQFAMYIFANMHGCADFPTRPFGETEGIEGIGKSLAYFKNCEISATQNIENVPENGFPMMGSLGDNVSVADGDGGTLILIPPKDANNNDGLPEVNGTPTDNLEIPLRAMYAKFSFTISVKPDQEIVGNKAPRFDVTGYTVHNIASTVDCDSSTNEDADVIAASYTTNPANYAQGATTATFDFYLPERYLTPATSADNYAYPFKGTYDTTVDTDQNGFRDEDEKYRQRFKPLLPGTDKKATYLTIEGKYLDHQGYTYDVSYDIYLGDDNYSNFDIIRNTHYNNTVTIKGISSSSDQASNENAISIDHRVDIERSTPLVINFRRETLLDAHYEVRPLRLRLVGDNLPTGASATVEILNEDGTSTDIPGWVRLEESGSTANHITTGVSAGKRKYFTTDLVTTTLAAKTRVIINNLSTTNQTVWVYVDEADPAAATTSKSTRAAIIRVTYTDGNGTSDTKDFKINQYNLHKITQDGRTYLMECYEEYLYNYDAEDSYGQTEYEGMPWGLNGVPLSNEHDSFTCNETNTSWTNYITNNPIKYDFYIGKHDDDNPDSDDKTKDGGILHNFAGQEFTSEIYTKSNGGVEVLDMSQEADGAVEYCYNRNKRNTDGSIAAVEWYLPSADELEAIMIAGYSDYHEFQDKYYWTSQPAYIRNAFYYEYQEREWTTDTYAFRIYTDNPNCARATKVKYENGQYSYVSSGLNKEPNPIPENEGDYDSNVNVDFGYFYKMPYWKTGSIGTFTIDDDNRFGGDQEFTEVIDRRSTGSRYHIHLGHLDNLIQEGYHERKRSNRVRCLRIMN